MEDAMIKTSCFMDIPGDEWPDPKWLAPYFLTPAGRRLAFATEDDNWGLTAEGVDGTESLPLEQQTIIDLYIVGKLDLGVLLFYDRRSATDWRGFYSKGNLKKLREWMVTRRHNRMPVGLFIPFEQALQAIVEFIKTDGAFPQCIEWVAAADLPEDSFPEPEVTLRG